MQIKESIIWVLPVLGLGGSLKLWCPYGTSRAKVSLLVEHSQQGIGFIIDDMIIADDEELEKQISRKKLAGAFKWRTQECWSYSFGKGFLLRTRYILSWMKYVLDLLKKIDELSCKTSGSP